MVKLTILFCSAVLCATSLAQFAPPPFVPGFAPPPPGGVPPPGGFLPGQFLFGPDCKSKGCGIQPGPFGPIFFGGACKSKGCPVPPNFPIPGVPQEPLPPAPPVCCTPDGCLNGYRTECVVGALTPRLRSQGFFVASGSCAGPLRKFNCQSAETVCSGNRQRCVFKRCPGPRTPPTLPPVPPRTRPTPPPGPKSRPPKHPYRMLVDEREVQHPVGNMDEHMDERYLQLIDRMINITQTVPEDMMPAEARQFGFGFADCKSKGCGLVPGPGGPLFFGGACKSKGCPVPPSFAIPPPPAPPVEPPTPTDPPLPPQVPPFVPPGRRQCCFSRPCETQRICRCVLAN